MTLRARFLRDETGAATVEFALVAPTMLITLFGLFDIGHGMYTKAQLQGAIEKASRNSTIEGATTGSLDTMVRNNVRRVSPAATVTFTRASYANFTDVGQAEDFGDVNSNGACDNGETFEDANANGVWDANRGQNGNGGARDAVLYGVTVSYPRLFPIGRLIGQPSTMTLNSTTILRNQPYGLQRGAPATGKCA